MLAMARLGKRLRQRTAGDLDFSTFILLKTVAHLGPMRLSALAAELDLDASTVSRHVKSLEDRGLLARTGDPDELIGSLVGDWNDQDREDLRRLLHQIVLSLDNQEHRP